MLDDWKRCPNCMKPLPPDFNKIMHVIISFLLVMAWGCAVYYIPKGVVILVAIPWALSIGFLKELYDLTHGGKFDWVDIVYDGIGIAFGAFILSVVFYAF